MKKLFFSILLILSLTSLKCSKDPVTIPDQLPPITTTGPNTFGCKVDGNVWLPYGGFSLDAITVSGGIIGKSSDIQIVTCNRKNNAQTDIDLIFQNIFDTGTYKIFNHLNEGMVYSDGNDGYEPFDTFGVVHISRCDTSNNIIAGTFSFMGYTDNTHVKKVNITDGRFDLHYPVKIHFMGQ